MYLRSLVVLTVLACGGIVSAEEAKWTNLLEKLDVRSSGVAGQWTVASGELSVDAAAGARIALPYQPKTEYDFRVSFTRTSGVHSIAMMFVCGPGQGTFEVDAWGQHLAGLQMIDGRSLQDNPTRAENHTLRNGQRYTMMIQVRRERVRAYLDDQLVSEHKTDGSDLSVNGVWRMPDATTLGIGAYQAATTFHRVEVRSTSNAPLRVTARVPEAVKMPSAAEPQRRSTGKRVLLVIANQDFFYREYHDPREELQRAGITVDVAAGRRTTCRPHANSGQQGNGDVMPDLAIADVDASRYDAIMFSGGWGSSMYQYAFDGTYGKQIYNGERQTKEAVNRLLGEFVQQDKYVAALCHGVSVLAWARIDGKSLLDGRRAVASPRQSPAGIYNGRRDQPLSRWNAEVNGARLSPARSIGDRQTSADDVMVDGKIVTGEDDNSARLFGRTLAQLVNGI